MNTPHPEAPLSDLARCLRDATKYAHYRLDHHPLLAPLVRSGLDARSYGLALSALHGPQAALERAVHRGLGEEANAFPGRLVDLEADLTKLSCSPLPLSAVLPTPDGAAECVGLLYLLEGSGMGGVVIARQLAVHLPDVPRGFFGAPDTPARWARFWRFAEGHCPPDQHPRAAAAALTGFAFIHTHLERCMESVAG